MLLNHSGWSSFEGESPCRGHVDFQGLLKLKQTGVSVYQIHREFHRVRRDWTAVWTQEGGVTV